MAGKTIVCVSKILQENQGRGLNQDVQEEHSEKHSQRTSFQG